MIPALSLLASASSSLAAASVTSRGPQPDKDVLRAEQKAVEDQKLQIMAQRSRVQARTQAGTAYHNARLENMQKALQRLLAGSFKGPAMVAVQTPVLSFGAATSAAYQEVTTGAGDDAVAVSGADVHVRTDDGADAVTVQANRVDVSTDDDGGNFGPTRYFANPDAVAISARHVGSVSTGDGADAIAIAAGTVGGVQAGDGNDKVAVTAVIAAGISGDGGDDDITVTAETGMVREPEPRSDTGRAMVAAWADGSAQGRMLRSWYAGGVSGGDGNDRIAVTVADTMGISGGAGNDSITAAGGTFALHFAAGDGQDRVRLTGGAEAVVMLDRTMTDDWTVERGEDSLTLRFGAGHSITFEGLAGAGGIGVSRLTRQDMTMLHTPPTLDLTA